MILRGKRNGAKSGTEAMGLSAEAGLVGERSDLRRRDTGRSLGAYRSENAGISSVKHVRTMFVKNLRFPTSSQSASG